MANEFKIKGGLITDWPVTISDITYARTTASAPSNPNWSYPNVLPLYISSSNYVYIDNHPTTSAGVIRLSDNGYASGLVDTRGNGANGLSINNSIVFGNWNKVNSIGPKLIHSFTDTIAIINSLTSSYSSIVSCSLNPKNSVIIGLLSPYVSTDGFDYINKNAYIINTGKDSPAITIGRIDSYDIYSKPGSGSISFGTISILSNPVNFAYYDAGEVYNYDSGISIGGSFLTSSVLIERPPKVRIFSTNLYGKIRIGHNTAFQSFELDSYIGIGNSVLRGSNKYVNLDTENPANFGEGIYIGNFSATKVNIKDYPIVIGNKSAIGYVSGSVERITPFTGYRINDVYSPYYDSTYYLENSTIIGNNAASWTSSLVETSSKIIDSTVIGLNASNGLSGLERCTIIGKDAGALVQYSNKNLIATASIIIGNYQTLPYTSSDLSYTQQYSNNRINIGGVLHISKSYSGSSAVSVNVGIANPFPQYTLHIGGYISARDTPILTTITGSFGISYTGSVIHSATLRLQPILESEQNRNLYAQKGNLISVCNRIPPQPPDDVPKLIFYNGDEWSEITYL